MEVIRNGKRLTVIDGDVATTYDEKKAMILAKEILNAINPHLRVVDKKYQVKISEFRVIG